MNDLTYRAVAWTPYIASPENLRRTDEAVAWTERQCRETGLPGYLRVPSHATSYKHGDGQLAAFARAHEVITNRGRLGGNGVYLVPMAYPRELASAMRRAHTFSLCATEHPAYPLIGWAMILGAVDLTTGERTPSTFSSEQEETLRHMADSGYNSYGSPPGDRAARRSMARLAESGLSYATFFGALMALAPDHADPKQLTRHLPPTWQHELTNPSADAGATTGLDW
ncbi:hypothetical protein KMZ32_16795 [Phycicoccus sp. MAQZ13P-2]|uniref:hypothetical protein n=1 Tax=Phycicoccus mangrovi TaxID=2840470 RepID=UPI001C008E2E|nr:hypothetical protein [Phycicoccus mangrovi]MBT9257388.1 hypothetical protein [Phycicoccus mangrovi]MBT9275737.1 hypothetical protein [Phycicoccus mangrovi]